jgi:hypothetical protein
MTIMTFIIMNSIALEYYDKRFRQNVQSAFIHLVREIGDIALAMEKSNSEHAKLKITEAYAILQYIASIYNLDLDTKIQTLYLHKLRIITELAGKDSKSSNDDRAMNSGKLEYTY